MAKVHSSETKEIEKHYNVKSCWFDDKEGLFHCIQQDNTEWISHTGSAQEEWIRIPEKGKVPRKGTIPPNTGSHVKPADTPSLTIKLSDEYQHNHIQEAMEYSLREKGFVKADSGKLQWSLLPFAELEEVVKVLMKGASKYSPDNWKKCDDTKRYEDALMRHVVAYIKGNKIDEVSQGGDGLSHLAHAICNCLFLMWFDNQQKEEK